MTEADRDALASYDFACLCMAERIKAGRPLTPREMVAAVDARAKAKTASGEACTLSGGVS